MEKVIILFAKEAITNANVDVSKTRTCLIVVLESIKSYDLGANGYKNGQSVVESIIYLIFNARLVFKHEGVGLQEFYPVPMP